MAMTRVSYLVILALSMNGVTNACAAAEMAGICVDITSDKDLARLYLRKHDLDDKSEFLDVYTTRGSDTAAELTIPRDGQCMPYLACTNPWNCERKPRCVFHSENGDLILTHPNIFVEAWGHEDTHDDPIRFYFSGTRGVHRYENGPDKFKLDEAPLLTRINKPPNQEIEDCMEH